MTSAEFGMASMAVVVTALIFFINIGDGIFGYAPRAIMYGFGLIGFTVLRSMGFFALLAKIILAAAAVLWLVYVFIKAQAGVVKHFDPEECADTAFVLWLLILAVSVFYRVFIPGPRPAPLALLEHAGLLKVVLVTLLYAAGLAGALQILEIILNRLFGQW